VVGALPFGQYRLLGEQIPDVVDLGAAYTGLRLIKSAEQVAALRRGAALTDAAVEAIAGALRPGVSDHEVLACSGRADPHTGAADTLARAYCRHAGPTPPHRR
jgi:hypothetical protein